MRIIREKMKNIQFSYEKADHTLKESIDRIGLAIPIQVKWQENHYICVDGNKRLSAVFELLKENPDHQKVQTVPMIVKNSMDKRSNNCWGSKNYH